MLVSLLKRWSLLENSRWDGTGTAFASKGKRAKRSWAENCMVLGKEGFGMEDVCGGLECLNLGWRSWLWDLISLYTAPANFFSLRQSATAELPMVCLPFSEFLLMSNATLICHSTLDFSASTVVEQFVPWSRFRRFCRHESADEYPMSTLPEYGLQHNVKGVIFVTLPSSGLASLYAFLWAKTTLTCYGTF